MTQTETVLTAQATTDAAAGNGQADDKTVAAGSDTGQVTETTGKTEATVTAPVVPEKYEAFKLPEGTELDATALAEFEPIAKELGLTQDGAQKVVDLYAGQVAKLAEAQQKLIGDTVAEWAKTAQADKEYGGDKFGANIAVAQKAISDFGSPELAKMLNETGLGNHPELIRFCLNVGKKLSEDSVVRGSKSAAAVDTAELFYGAK
jgi:hypothetical protein